MGESSVEIQSMQNTKKVVHNKIDYQHSSLSRHPALSEAQLYKNADYMYFAELQGKFSCRIHNFPGTHDLNLDPLKRLFIVA